MLKSLFLKARTMNIYIFVAVTFLFLSFFFVASLHALSKSVDTLYDQLCAQKAEWMADEFDALLDTAQNIAVQSDVVGVATNGQLSIDEIVSSYPTDYVAGYTVVYESSMEAIHSGITFPVEDAVLQNRIFSGEPTILFSNATGAKTNTYIAAGVPLYNHENEIQGALIVFFPLSEIISSVDPMGVDELILEANGETVVPLRQSSGVGFSTDESQVLRENIIQQKAMTVYSQGYLEYSFGNHKKAVFYEQIRDTEWIYVLYAEGSFESSGIRTLRFLSYAATVLSLFVLVWLYFYFRNMTNQLDKAENRSNNAINVANVMFIEITSDGVVKEINANFTRLTGYESDDVKNKKLIEFLPIHERSQFSENLLKILQSELLTDINIPIELQDGSIKHLLCNVSISNVQNNRIVDLFGIDITYLKEYQNKIHKLAYFDVLTDLPNQTYLEEYIEKLFQFNKMFAFIYVDFDNFKVVNDTYGHAVGDLFIKEVCKQLINFQMPKAMPFRLGGDEIAILYSDPEDFGEIGDYANLVMNVANSEFDIESIKINTTCSIGISLYPNNAKNYSDLFKMADIAMNRAKEMGKARVIFFNAKMHEELISSAMLEKDLKEAFLNNEFFLCYQPQYDLRTGELYGFEALMRLTTPSRGFVSPGLFIPALEKNQLIIPIGNQALYDAAVFAKELASMGYPNICISVNVSVVQLINDQFADTVVNILNEVGVDYKNIKLELTESVIMESIDTHVHKVRGLSNMGIAFALDDFGTGYSSLTYLKKLPFQVLKIDKSFVDTILEKDESRDIISIVIELAHKLRLQVVAEGVETEQQLNWLREQGCNICQGYYSGRPLTREDAKQLMGRNLYFS